VEVSEAICGYVRLLAADDVVPRLITAVGGWAERSSKDAGVFL
jgi:hypothetical protein